MNFFLITDDYVIYTICMVTCTLNYMYYCLELSCADHRERCVKNLLLVDGYGISGLNLYGPKA